MHCNIDSVVIYETISIFTILKEQLFTFSNISALKKKSYAMLLQLFIFNKAFMLHAI